MSKKIIYLLSLLMALSLVFAGCKKASTAPTGDGPTKEDEVKPPENLDATGGLMPDSAELDKYKERPIQKSTEVAKYQNGDYMRNPVITVVGNKTVVVFYEIRHQTTGAGNDVALTGDNGVSIAYVQSKNSGISFSTALGDVKYVGGKSTGPENAHGAPIVFYDKINNKIIVVASAGIGLSSGVYNEGTGKVSKLAYSVADIKDNTVGDFGAWKDIQDPGSVAKNGYTQYGTHSARGTVAEDGKTLLLPVTLADYTVSPSKFGYVLYTGTVGNNNEVTWTATMKRADMPNGSGVVKETRIPKGASENDYVYLAVSSDTKRISQGKGPQAPSSANIQGSDGSAGTLVVPNWFGDASYDPKKISGGTKQAILSHVLETEQNLAIRLVDADFANQQGKSFQLGGAYTGNSKSSSMDVLGDGTIVMIAEGGKVTDAATRPFYIYFSRFSQAYIANQTK
ncbi:sialidase family protein [uncultured Brachyspira sp.]|uniref:sialidase family protein n=1 Tax=uncultured Brachyspira sp. TaxID=221953 RepID=UPI0025DEB86F|nr:sialidase family protein [uncultured Brachyspira sp.]